MSPASPNYARDLEAKVNMLEERLAKLEADSAQALAKPAVDGVVLPGKTLMIRSANGSADS